MEQEKEETEDKYKKERKKRMNTERRLRVAEDSLKRLDKALKDSGIKIDLQIETDVKNLKGTPLIVGICSRYYYTLWARFTRPHTCYPERVVSSLTNAYTRL